MAIDIAILRGIEEAYQGEVYGIVHYRAIRDTQTDPLRRWQWDVLVQLEVETKAAMAGLLQENGGDTSEAEASRQAGLADAERLLRLDYLPMIRAFAADLPGLIVQYDALRQAAMGAVADVSALDMLVRHEEVTLAFCLAELAGENDAIAPVLAMLAHPPKQ